MLCLQNESNPEWIPVALANINAILYDHAHCEKKAASFAMTLIHRYPEKRKLVDEMTIIIHEEIEHFQLVLALMNKRGISFGLDRGSIYARKLHALLRKEEPWYLLDSLIAGALIEARSCERFSLLSKHIQDNELQEFYTSLLASEAGHYATYTDIARQYFSHTEVKQRINELSTQEAEIVRSLQNRPSMHG